jgi:hypothetical protein
VDNGKRQGDKGDNPRAIQTRAVSARVNVMSLVSQVLRRPQDNEFCAMRQNKKCKRPVGLGSGAVKKVISQMLT